MAHGWNFQDRANNYVDVDVDDTISLSTQSWRTNRTILTQFVGQLLKLLNTNSSFSAYEQGGSDYVDYYAGAERTVHEVLGSEANTSATNDSSRENGEFVEQYAAFSQILIIIAGTILSIVTAGGNLMVLLSFKIDRSLRTISNFFLLSLAVADLTIGLISCPLMTLYTVKNEWTLSYAACQFWLSIDYTMSNASVLNLLLISFDRFFSVTMPLTYRPRRTTKKALTMIASTYVVSTILWPPWIIAWPYIEGGSRGAYFAVPDNVCMVQFILTNPIVTIGTAFAAFYLPVFIMILLYAKVYLVTQRRQGELKKLQGHDCSRGQQVKTDVGSASTVCETSPSPGATVITNHTATSPLLNNRSLSIRKKSSQRFRRFSTVSQNRRFSVLSALSALSSVRSVGGLLDCCRESCRGSPSPISTSQEESALLSNITTTKVVTSAGGNESPLLARNGWSSSRNAPQSSRLHVRRLSDSAKIEAPVRTRSSFRSNARSFYMAKRRSSEAPVLSSVVECENASLTENNRSASTYTVLIRFPTDGSKKPEILSSDNSKTERPTTEGKLNTVVSINGPNSTISTTVTNVPFLDARRGVPSSLRQSTRSQKSTLTISDDEERDSTITNSSKLPLMPQSSTPPARRTVNAVKMGQQVRRSERSERKADSKAAKTLSAILLAFIVTWLPYNVFVCIGAFHSELIPAWLWTLAYYGCYLNSTVNPVLYALCNAQFQKSFKRILTCQWSERRRNATDSKKVERRRK